jgi:hypothetical protein
MLKLPCIAAALLGLAASAVAQNCTVPPAQRTFSNRPDFGASFYYNLGNHLFDLNVQRNIAIASIKTWTYDQGAGNPVVPNQVGATGQVDFYTCPTTRLGNETNAPTNPGSPWTLLGSGTITVVATPGESTIVFNPPLVLAAGQWGCALNYLPTTNGPAPGPLHCLGVNPNPNTPVSDQFLTFSNDAIQQTAWTGTGTDSPNLRITYTPDAASAHYVSVGDGCYFRPHAFYERFLPGPTSPDIQNTGQSWVNLGANYVVVPAAPTLVPSTSPSITLQPYGSSSSASWDDALSTPILLPFTFNFPGGSTTDITISSNGFVFLRAVTNNTYDYCGSAYGSILGFRDLPPRIAPFYVDLDPTTAGSIHYDVDPSNQFVRITWNACVEWTPVINPASLNTMQLTLWANGNVDVVYGALANRNVNDGNDGIYGFTDGDGNRLPPAIDISASLPYTSGDGAIPPVLEMDARPVIGTTPNIVTKNITAGTLVQILAAGDQLAPVPIDLGIIGMPGCLLTTNPFVFLTNVITPNNTFVQPFQIPNLPSLQNQQLVFQAAPLTPGLNPLGLLLSNAICTRVGQ